MIKQFEKLTPEEIEILLQAPILISILAASENNKISRRGKADAIKLAHLKTFTADPLLLSYYKEVDKNFKNYFEAAVNKYVPFDEAKNEMLIKKANDLNKVMTKLDKEYAKTLHRSLSGYAEHVRRAERSVLESFIFPLPIPGLTD